MPWRQNSLAADFISELRVLACFSLRLRRGIRPPPPRPRTPRTARGSARAGSARGRDRCRAGGWRRPRSRQRLLGARREQLLEPPQTALDRAAAARAGCQAGAHRLRHILQPVEVPLAEGCRIQPPRGLGGGVAHQHLAARRRGAQPRRHVHGGAVPVARAGDRRPGVHPDPYRRETLDRVKRLHDLEAERHGLRRLVTADHESVADRLYLLRAAVSEQRANALVELERDVRGAVVSLRGREGREAHEVGEEKGVPASRHWHTGKYLNTVWYARGVQAGRRLKFWGWGREDQHPSHTEVEQAAAGLRAHLGFGAEEVERPVRLEDVRLRAPRLQPPEALKGISSTDPYERAAHAYGKSYRDLVRAFRGEFDHPPDVVTRPRDEDEVTAVLEWCAEAGAAAIPYGGGTSVVGGVEPDLPDRYSGAVTMDLKALDRVLELDPVSRAARIQAGATGPRLEDQLREQGLTLRHFPQSFEYSTLGGWIATRAGGHFATLYTHIDDLVESVRAVTLEGDWESRRLPGSGAGPSPDRMLIGSEGILAVITDAWVRVRERPSFKLSVGVAFDDFAAGSEAVREISQSGLNPSNCRLLDAVESDTTSAGPPGKALLVLGFESAHHPVDEPMAIALAAARAHGGEPGEIKGGGRDGQEQPGPAARRDAPAPSEPGEDPVNAWRHAFLFAPYLRDSLVACGVLSDTFETAITWDRFPDLHAEVMDSARRAVAKASAASPEGRGSPRVSCRFTHVYPDGPAPYYTVLAPARRGDEVAQWDEIKAAVSDAVIDAGGTITHHHAIGRDHRPWYDRQRPDPFADALRAAKRELDPKAVLNPGVLIDP